MFRAASKTRIFSDDLKTPQAKIWSSIVPLYLGVLLMQNVDHIEKIRKTQHVTNHLEIEASRMRTCNQATKDSINIRFHPYAKIAQFKRKLQIMKYSTIRKI